MAVSLKTFRSLVTYFPLGLFVMSLPLVAFTYQGTDGLESPPGYILLLIGPILIAGGAALEWLTWLANPVAAAALYFFIAATRSARLKNVRARAEKRCKWLSLLAVCIVLSFRLWKTVLRNEAGAEGPILSFNAGYYLWAGSVTLFCLGIHLYFFNVRRQN